MGKELEPRLILQSIIWSALMAPWLRPARSGAALRAAGRRRAATRGSCAREARPSDGARPVARALVRRAILGAPLRSGTAPGGRFLARVPRSVSVVPGLSSDARS